MLCALTHQLQRSVYAVRGASVCLVHRDVMGVAIVAVSSVAL